MIACHAVTALGVVALALASAAPDGLAVTLLLLGQFLYGLAMGASNSHEMSYRQLLTPDELQARTNTTMRTINRAVVVVVAPVAGIVADAWGITQVLWVAVTGFALVVAGLAVSPFRSARAPA